MSSNQSGEKVLLLQASFINRANIKRAKLIRDEKKKAVNKELFYCGLIWIMKRAYFPLERAIRTNFVNWECQKSSSKEAFKICVLYILFIISSLGYLFDLARYLHI